MCGDQLVLIGIVMPSIKRVRHAVSNTSLSSLGRRSTKVANAEPARRERSVHLDKRRKSVPQGESTCGGGYSQARDEGSKQVQRSAVGVATSDDTRRRRRSLGCRRVMGASPTQRSAPALTSLERPPHLDKAHRRTWRNPQQSEGLRCVRALSSAATFEIAESGGEAYLVTSLCAPMRGGLEGSGRRSRHRRGVGTWGFPARAACGRELDLPVTRHR